MELYRLSGKKILYKWGKLGSSRKLWICPRQSKGRLPALVQLEDGVVYDNEWVFTSFSDDDGYSKTETEIKNDMI